MFGIYQEKKMTTTLIIARHGNTFNPNEKPTRVGARTDLPLVETGIKQAKRIGAFCQQHHLIPDVTFCSLLQRTRQTAEIAFPNIEPTPLALFNEIDYGPDENQTEESVIKRIGQKAIDAWNTEAIVPPDWKVNPIKLIEGWLNFSHKILKTHPNRIIFVATSNGVARFAPHILGDIKKFTTQHEIKLKTGALSLFTHNKGQWQCEFWNKTNL